MARQGLACKGLACKGNEYRCSGSHTHCAQLFAPASLCCKLACLARGIMNGITAAWDMAVAVQAPLGDDALTGTLLAWAKMEVDNLAQYNEKGTHNVFALAAIGKLCDGTKGRPDLLQLCKIPELVAWVLSFPQASKFSHVRVILHEVHKTQALRLPALSDDEHWLTQQAKRLCNLRTNATFAKKYPSRVQYRCTMLSPGDMAILTLMLEKMAHVQVLQPCAAVQVDTPMPEKAVPERAEPERAALAPAPAAPESAAVVAAPPTPALGELFSPSPAKGAPPYAVACNNMGIPLMFASPPVLRDDMLGHASLQRPAGQAVRPVHKGAASKQFAKEKKEKEEAGAAQKTPTKQKKDRKLGKSAQKQSKSASAPKKRPADDFSAPDVVAVKYTKPKTPPRTYVQAWWQEKWRHVITVAAHEHERHCEIVMHVGEELRSGRLTYDQAREQKKVLLTTWAK